MLFLLDLLVNYGSLLKLCLAHTLKQKSQLFFQLTNLSRGDQPILEYCTPFLDKEFVTHCLNGLGQSNESFVTSITT